jgi:CarboxypepD_reg-like domain
MISNKKYSLLIKKIISSCLFLIATAYCYGQLVPIKGYVHNENGQALANVSVVAKQGAVIKAYDITNAVGLFQLNLQAKQDYTIECSSIGYDKLIISLNTATEIAQKKFILKQKFTAEDTVRVIAKRGVYERGDTIFYNTDVFKKNNENNLKDLLKNIPGIIVTPSGKIIADGQMVNKLLIDGKDLTGENYEKIVNNLSPHNIDQLQVLKKYKDPYELSNSATGNTEVAINITFKNKRIIPSAKISTSLGFPIKYYEHKTDFLVLTKPVTSINFINLNSIGNTAQLINSPNSLFGNVNTELFKKLGKGLPYQNSVNELFLKITKNNYSFNNTQYFDNSSQFNIGEKITNKCTFNYTPEKIEQTETSLSQTFIGNQFFAETNSLSNPIINKKAFSIKNELIYMLKKNEQIKWNASYLIEKENSANNSLLNATNVSFNNNNKKVFANSLVNYTKFLRNATVINVAGFYDIQINNESLKNSGIVYNNSIFSNSFGLAKSLEQNIETKENNIGAYFKLIKRKNDYSFTFQPTIKKIFGSLQSSLTALATTNLFYKNIDSFKNDYSYQQTSISMPIMYGFRKDSFGVSLSLEPILVNSQIHNITNRIINYKAAMSTNYILRNGRRLYFSLARNYDFTFTIKLFAANVIVNNKDKINATNFLLKDQSYNVSIGSNKFGSYNNKPNFSYRVSGNINTPNYLLNNTNNNFYSIQNYLNYLATNKGINAGIGNNFTSEKLKVRVENDINLSSRKSVSSQNNIIISSVSNNYNLENRIISRFKGMFNFQLNNALSYNTNKRDGTSNLNKSITDVISVDINLNYMKKSHIDIEARNYYFNTFNGNVQNIFLANVSYKQLLNNNKLRLNIEFRNVTNKKAFVSQNISITQFYESRVALLPFFALVKLEFLL